MRLHQSLDPGSDDERRAFPSVEPGANLALRAAEFVGQVGGFPSQYFEAFAQPSCDHDVSSCISPVLTAATFFLSGASPSVDEEVETSCAARNISVEATVRRLQPAD
jgi:hypothetical protein